MKRPGNLGFVTDSPIFDAALSYPGDPMQDEIYQRSMAQRAMEAGRPLTIAEMHGGQQQQLFSALGMVDLTPAEQKAKVIKLTLILGLGILLFTTGPFALLLGAKKVTKKIRRKPRRK